MTSFDRRGLGIPAGLAQRGLGPVNEEFARRGLGTPARELAERGLLFTTRPPRPPEPTRIETTLSRLTRELSFGNEASALPASDFSRLLSNDSLPKQTCSACAASALGAERGVVPLRPAKTCCGNETTKREQMSAVTARAAEAFMRASGVSEVSLAEVLSGLGDVELRDQPSGPGLPGTTPPWSGSVPDVPARDSNAIWTQVAAAERLRDIAGNAGWAWATGESGALYVMSPSSAAFEKVPTNVRCVRVSAFDNGAPAVITTDGKVRYAESPQAAQSGNLVPLPNDVTSYPITATDIATGLISPSECEPPQVYVVSDGAAHAFRPLLAVNEPGAEVCIAFAFQWQPLPASPKTFSRPSRIFARVDVPTGAALSVLTNDGAIFQQAGDTLLRDAQATSGNAPKGIGIAAYRQELWVIDASGQIWHKANLATWRKVNGLGSAIAFDAITHSLWVIRNGKAWNRGGRQLAIWPSGRERPLPPNPTTSDWCKFFADPAKTRDEILAEFADHYVQAAVPQIFNVQVWANRTLGDDLNWQNALSTYANYGYDVWLSLPVIQTGKKVLPGAIMSLPFNDPKVLQGFKNYFHGLITSPARDVIKYVTIGTEVDVFLENTQGWDEFIDFYSAAADYVRERLPGCRVGSCMTQLGAQKDYELAKIQGHPTGARVRQLNTDSDVSAFTYYPWSQSLMPTMATSAPPLTPQLVGNDFDRMVNELSPDKPVVLQEIGVPTDSLFWPGRDASREAGKFMLDAVTAWQKHALRIAAINWFLMYDLDVEAKNGQSCSACNPCKNPSCHRCGLGDLLTANLVGSNMPVEWFNRLFGSMGLFESNGTPKELWSLFRAISDSLKQQA